MRAAAWLLAALLVVAGCSLGSPAGTRPIVAQIRNTEAIPVELAIETSTGVVPGGVQPSTLAAGGVQRVTLFVPPGDDWMLTVNGTEMFYAPDIADYEAMDCGSLRMEVSTDGSGSVGC